MRGVRASRSSQPHGAVALVAAAWLVLWILVIGAHSTLLHSESAPSHPSHAPPTLLGAETAVNVDPAHVDTSPTGHHHEHLVTVVLPRGASTFAAAGLVAWVATRWLVHAFIARSGSDPPEQSGLFVAGQQFLTRLCISRR